MSRLVRSLSACGILGALFGCGGLANPDGSIATVSGNLKGTAPNGAHVALVWHSPKGEFVVTNDTAVVNGAFAFDLEGPPDDSLFSVLNTSQTSNSGATPPTANSSSGGASSSGSGGASPAPSGKSYGLQLLDTVSGTVSAPLSFAVAGFVVYEDKNGNGKLDLTGSNADSPDKIVGGSNELLLTYLRDGSDLELEKLRDSAGQKPTRGYQLAWIPKGRWLPLTGVDLTIGVDVLPDDVCYGGTGSVNSTTLDVSGNSSTPSSGVDPVGPVLVSDGGTTTDDAGSSGSGTGGSSGGYPSSSDPNVTCSSDGRSFSYVCTYDAGTGGGTIDAGSGGSSSRGLCGATFDTQPYPSAGVAERCYPGAKIGASDPVPSGWPCTVTMEAKDGGPVPDSGAMDGGSAPDSGK